MEEEKNYRKSRIKWTIATILLLATVAVIILPPAIVLKGKYQIYPSIDMATETPVAIVFGAGVRPDGHPTDMLEDRLITANSLYQSGKISKILVSGDNRTSHYNEPQAMFNYLQKLGVPATDIVLDYAGRRTYDTCYRAKEIFGVNDAILVTQGYHLPRALFLCNKFGVKSTGISATTRLYEGESYYELREILALYGSVLDVYITRPTPVLGEPLPIIID